jgi:predicted acylesterase/phospholipase RssA
VHDSGRLLDWVSTSMSVPGIAPPTVYHGDLLVDGGIVNNLPTDVMQLMGRGRVIGSDVSSARELRVDGIDTSEPQDLLRVRRSARAVSIATILVRTATLVEEEEMKARAANSDLYLRMPVQGIGMFDWRSLDALVDLGYQHAREGLERYFSPGKEASGQQPG